MSLWIMFVSYDLRLWAVSQDNELWSRMTVIYESRLPDMKQD